MGDEARSVFGPIPDDDCRDGVAKTIGLEVEGDLVDLVPNTTKPGNPLEFEYKDTTGRVVKWSSTVAKCDKPSLAGGVTYCGMNSRLNVVKRGNVEWLAFCRKSKGTELTADPTWQASNPTFSLLGTIGFNVVSGEVVFFDGREDGFIFDWSNPFIAPGGHGYADTAGRTNAEALYDPTFRIECSACHDNKNPHITDPHAEMARVGYSDPTISSAFSLGDFLPEYRHKSTLPYRVVGSDYTATYASDLAGAKSVADPTGNCTECHSLTTQETGIRFSADAVNKKPSVTSPTSEQASTLADEITQFLGQSSHRTDWALRSGSGKIHPWMVPDDGNNPTPTDSELSDADWKTLSDCLWGNGGASCGYQPLFNTCPAPESSANDTTRIADPSAPTSIAASVGPVPSPTPGVSKAVLVSWTYLNALGGVPERDDVRFNIAFRETDIPPGGAAPSPSDYPSLDATRGVAITPIDDHIGRVGDVIVLGDTSYSGHIQWTDASPTTTGRTYKVNFPGTCGKRILIRILPKRYCFDQSGEVFGSVDHVVYADVSCS